MTLQGERSPHLQSLLTLPDELAAVLAPERSQSNSELTASRFIVGVDGGGTRTRAILYDAAARQISRAEGGPSDPYTLGFELASETICSTIAATGLNGDSAWPQTTVTSG